MAAAVDVARGLGSWRVAGHRRLLTDAASGVGAGAASSGTLLARNPLGDAFDQPLRAALTALMRGGRSLLSLDRLPLALLRDRISVPRDMPLHSARLLRRPRRPPQSWMGINSRRRSV